MHLPLDIIFDTVSLNSTRVANTKVLEFLLSLFSVKGRPSYTLKAYLPMKANNAVIRTCSALRCVATS